MNSAQQKIRRRHKVRVKDYNQLALRCLQSLVQRACLVSRTIGAMNITDWMPLCGIVLYQTTGHVHGFVSRIVKHLDVEAVLRILQPVAVHAIASQENQNHEIGDEQCHVEGIGLINSSESLIKKVLIEILR